MFSKNIRTIFNFIAGATSILGLLFFLYFQFLAVEITQIEIKEIDLTRLTEKPDIDKLSVSYEYDSTEVKNLWKLKYFIQNIGSKTIIGEGQIKSIIPEKLPLSILGVDRVFDLEISASDFPVSLIKKNNSDFLLDFKQWKTGQYFEINGLVETTIDQEPSINIDSQDIIDSEVIYSVYVPSDLNENSKLIELFPKGFSVFLKWVVVISIIIADLVGLITVIGEIRKREKSENKRDLRYYMIMVWLILAIIYTAPLLWIF